MAPIIFFELFVCEKMVSPAPLYSNGGLTHWPAGDNSGDLVEREDSFTGPAIAEAAISSYDSWKCLTENGTEVI
jgi:hypothetical protein